MRKVRYREGKYCTGSLNQLLEESSWKSRSTWPQVRVFSSHISCLFPFLLLNTVIQEFCFFFCRKLSTTTRNLVEASTSFIPGTKRKQRVLGDILSHHASALPPIPYALPHTLSFIHVLADRTFADNPLPTHHLHLDPRAKTLVLGPNSSGFVLCQEAVKLSMPRSAGFRHKPLTVYLMPSFPQTLWKTMFNPKL